MSKHDIGWKPVAQDAAARGHDLFPLRGCRPPLETALCKLREFHMRMVCRECRVGLLEEFGSSGVLPATRGDLAFQLKRAALCKRVWTLIRDGPQAFECGFSGGQSPPENLQVPRVMEVLDPHVLPRGHLAGMLQRLAAVAS